MRLPTASCLLCRPSILLKRLNTQRVAAIPSRPASSLSAIHNGLRQSQKSKPQGFNRSSLETAKPRRREQGEQGEQAARRGRDRDWTPPTFKIKKGKKDITDTGPGRQSRRSKFNDPNNSFGKRSLVYQMKHGELRKTMAELDARKPSRRPTDRLSSSDFMKDFEASHGHRSKSTRDDPKRSSSSARAQPFPDRTVRAKSVTNTRNRDYDRTNSSFPETRHKGSRETRDNARGLGSSARSRPFPDQTGHARPVTNSRSHNHDRTDSSFAETRRKGFTDTSPARTSPEASIGRAEQSSRIQNKDEQDAGQARESRRVDDGPIRVHHTTAASQFLYGRAVVTAALKDSRRQLYKLYIYSGGGRRNTPEDEAVATLARQKGVEVTNVSNDGLRMMDKMSLGRPHNGYILEASPLPQLPVKALGPVSEDPKKPGFHVELMHQSSEEAKINGTSDFFGYQLPKGRNPFVLLLDGILDPANLGAILRTAAFLGVNGIAITKESSATLTATALKASAGASEVATLFSVHSAVGFLARSKENGWLVYAAVPSTKRSKGNSHLTVDRVETHDPLSSHPTVLVVGSEGEGITKPVRRQADHEVSIPNPSGAFSSVVDSLNVSVATGILCSAFLKKQSLGMLDTVGDVSGPQHEGESNLW